MASYLTLDRFKLLSTMPSSFVDEVETRYPGFTAAQIELASARIDAKLRKRYAFPVTDPTKVPLVVESWIALIVTPDVFLKRGIAATDEQWEEYAKRKDLALAELEAAANSETGLFDLPLRNDDSQESGIVYGAPMVYSEQSPYVGFDRQAEIGHAEDEQRGGSGTGGVL